MMVLGLNAYHADAAACLVQDGRVLVAIEEERQTRCKHTAGFPSHAVRACMAFAGITADQIDVIGIARDPTANVSGRFRRAISGLRNPRRLSRVLARRWHSPRRLRAELASVLSTDPIALAARIVGVEHHVAHIASAFYCSPYDSAAGVSVDGLGDNLSTLIAQCDANGITRIEQVAYPHSLGFFYTAITQYLGFLNYGDEYKVMGLAAMGQPSQLHNLRDVLRVESGSLFELGLAYFAHAEGEIDMTWESGVPHLPIMYSPALSELLGPPRAPDDPIQARHRDIACSAQVLYERALQRILRTAFERTTKDTLVLAGGCAQNSMANGRVPAACGFKHVYAAPSSHDGGTAVGAALWLAADRGNVHYPQRNPFLGSEIDTAEVESLLRGVGMAPQYFDDERCVFAAVIDCVVAGGIVGWVQGRAEWGPRALGHRSILADPRRADIKAILNGKIKQRESFRPFAPSICIEDAAQWFIVDEPNDRAPYMEKVVTVREPCRHQIPGVVHADGSARVQLVERELDPRFWALLQWMGGVTGVPILVNTSFNENEPIVETAHDAVACFQRTAMDMLVVNSLVVHR
ncbi:MAG: carbamoyltransferase [Gammaproteobacteria bacterium]|nr:carbamoyltransferase [Gammaproteobacteria bacterium]